MTERFAAVAIGCSSGGLDALERILPALPSAFPAAVIVVMHTTPESRNLLVELLGKRCRMPVSEARERSKILPGAIYVAPPGYHLLVEDNHTFSLSSDPKVSYARPSVDVLFESAAHAYGKRLIGVILTGANSDGSNGLRAIAEAGGMCLVQDPAGAEAQAMPEAALRTCMAARGMPLDEIAETLIEALK